MTKKHFIAFANSIKQLVDKANGNHELLQYANSIGKVVETMNNNPRFNKQKFRMACGLSHRQIEINSVNYKHNMNDNTILESILKIIGRDSELMSEFAAGIGIEEEELGNFIDEVEFPMLGRKNKHDI